MEQKQETTQIDVGGILRHARERVGMSVEDVAARLKFAPRQITALEEGNFDQLPEPAFVRGFVRSYARLLQLDETALLKALPSAAPAQEALVEKAAKPDVVPREFAASAQNIRWLAGALVVALVLGILAWQHDGTQAPPKPQVSEKTETETKTAAEPEIAGVAPAASAPVAAPLVAAVVAPPPAPAALASPNSTQAPASSVAANKDNARKRVGRLVRLEFDEDSWVEVKDANGKLLLSMLGKQGTTQGVSGPVPLSVTVGNAKGVRLYYKGQAVDLESDAEANVAHVILE